MTGQRQLDGPVRGSVFALPIGLAMWAVIIGGVVAVLVR